MSKDSLREMLEEQQKINEMRRDTAISNNTGKKRADSKINKAILIIFPILMVLLFIFGRSKNHVGMGICFLLLGIFVSVLPVIKRSVMLKRCTENIPAVCVHLNSRTNRRVTTYAPKWEYSFNGQVYEHQELLYSNIGVPKIGDEYEIFVNPDDPYEVYRKNFRGDLFQFIFGVVFIVIGVLTIMF